MFFAVQFTQGNRRVRRISRAQYDAAVAGTLAGFTLRRRVNARMVFIDGDGPIPEGGAPPAPLVVTIDPPESPPWDATSSGQILPFQLAARGGVPPYTFALEETFPDSISNVSIGPTGTGTVEFLDEEDIGFQYLISDSVGTEFRILAAVRWLGA
jgi:hypothetical protein